MNTFSTNYNPKLLKPILTQRLSGYLRLMLSNEKVIIVIHKFIMEDVHMSEQIEIEFKNLLTFEEFNHLMQHFKIKPEHFTVQKNHYFDTVTFDLKKYTSALRIREKNSSYEMTLKQPLENQKGLLETNWDIDPDTANKIIKDGGIPDSKISERIKNLKINPQEIRYFGTLTTKRVELPFKSGLLVLDNSSYFQIEDYEVEFEVDNFDQGKKEFDLLLSEAGIPVRPTENKVQRFYNQMILNHTEE